MIVNDFDFIRSRIGPSETDPILLVDSNTVLSRTIAPQFFQTIPWRDREVAEFGRRIQLIKLSKRYFPQRLRAGAAGSILGQMKAKRWILYRIYKNPSYRWTSYWGAGQKTQGRTKGAHHTPLHQ